MLKNMHTQYNVTEVSYLQIMSYSPLKRAEQCNVLAVSLVKTAFYSDIL